MTLKVKYFLFIAIIHLVIGVLIFQLLGERKIYFLLAEAGIIISLILSYQLYKSFIQPLDFMYTGVDAIEDKDFNVKFVETGSREMDKLIGVYNNMIDNIREERIQVKEQHFFLQKLINASPTGIIILDYDDKVADINPKAKQLLDWQKEWTNLPLSDIDNPVLKSLTKLETSESKVLTVNGSERFRCEVSHFVHQGFHRKFILIQELSKEILEAEKRAYEKVIRMMAHEVNNSIGAINSILQTTHDFYETDDLEIDREVKSSLKIAMDRNDNLNKFMRNFADVIRLPKPVFEQVELNTLVKNIAMLMQQQAKFKQINFVYDLYSDNIYKQLDTRQIEQALVNIIKNAIESIGDNGTIKFITRPNGIIIADNGAGIADEVADKLFTPFFSTKVDGQGVGLTLVREILLNHSAQFSLWTKGDWTEFKIELS